MRPVWILLGTVLVGGCSQLGDLALFKPRPDVAVQDGADQTRPVARPDGAGAPPPPKNARTVEEFDTTSEAERAAAAAPAAAPASAARLGVTVASLGDPARPGFWLETPLVSAPAKGRVVFPGTGQAAQVDLIPIDGPPTAGSRLSLAAMRLIGAPLTGLPEIEVFRGE